MPEKKTIFISLAGADNRWAELIASVVRDAGHEPFFEDEDFQVGQSIPDNMMRGAEADCTIAVFSPAYFKSEFCLAELDAALMKDPLGRHGRLIPVRVAPVEIPGLVGQLAYLDLVGATDDIARARLTATLQKHGHLDATEHSLIGRTRRAVEQADRNRRAMIQKVRTIWIDGVLKKSLFHEVRIPLGLSERPDAVDRPLVSLVMRPEEGELPLPSGTRAVDIFDNMDKKLLILGEPGSGKTALLLELTRDLLTRATNDPAHPIPVVIPLSTWAHTRKPLVEWLQAELQLLYDIPRAVAHEWVVTNQVLPLLDGLDEVKVEHRVACVEAINLFRQSRGFLPLAITSRTADYKALGEPLQLQGAIVVRPLTREQVDTYLTELGFVGEQVRAAIHEDSSLWELLDSPLLLNIVTVAYAIQPEAPPPMTGSLAVRRDHLFGSYVDKMLLRGPADARYTHEQTIHWLRWLADQMGSNGQTVFYLEKLQFGWLPERQRRSIRDWNRLVAFLIAFLIGGPIVGLGVARGVALVAGYARALSAFEGITLINGSIAGLYAVLGVDKEITCAEVVRWSWSKLRRAVRLSRTQWRPLFLLVGWVVSGLSVGLLMGSPGVQFGQLIICCIGAFMGLLVGGLVIGLDQGLSLTTIERRDYLNQGIIRSLQNAAFVGLTLALAITLVGGFVGVLFAKLRILQLIKPDLTWGGGLLTGLIVGLGAGIGAGLGVALDAGGSACLSHYILRLLLIRNGSTPRKYDEFLDYAAKRILLRKVGGGYMFIHRMLLEWFAARYVELGGPRADGNQGDRAE
jgi:eukaryotic-like serine/threonine-protein kinase